MSAVTVCALSDIAPGASKRVMVGSTPVVVVRIDDSVYALHDKCSHADVALSDGEIDCDLKTIECIRHGSRFELETGRPDTLPATQPVRVFTARVVDGQVVIDDAEETTKDAR